MSSTDGAIQTASYGHWQNRLPATYIDHLYYNAETMPSALTIPLTHRSAYLRPIEEADTQRWLSYLQTDAVRPGISWRPQGIEELGNFVNSTDLHKPGAQVRFAIAGISDNTLLGSVGFHSISIPHHSAEIAYDLHPDQWGKGLATEACREIIQWAFGHGLTRIQATVLTNNQASVRVLERLGFELEGRLRKYRWVDHTAHDALMYSFLRA